MGSSIQVASGTIIDPLHPNVDRILIEDIAHGLANQCRFAGHTRTHYSVAEHCVRLSEIVPRRDALWGLLHDATETYLIDLPSPLKRDPAFGDRYRKAEAKLLKAIAMRFGLVGDTVPETVHHADLRMLMTEVRDLMPHIGSDEERELWKPWLGRTHPLPAIIVPWSARRAEQLFLKRYRQLKEKP
jgi:hypothetical protein